MKRLISIRLLISAGVVLAVATALAQNPPGTPPRDSAAKPPVGTATISGVVVTDDATPAPVRRARVTVKTDAYGNGWSATTDDQGRFVFSSLPTGRYSVQASRPAWLVANYGATRPGRPGTPIAVADGQQVQGIRLQMSRGGVMTGTVLDRSGEPVPTVMVSALRYTYSEITGERVLARATSDVATDDQGVYRLFGMMPGEYLIVATLRSGPATALMDLRRTTADEVTQAIASARSGGPPSASPPVSQTGPQLVGYAPVYLPGVADVARAAAVRLGTSEEKAGLNITIDVVPTARVEVVATMPENGNRQSLQVYLLSGQQTTQTGASGMMTGRRDPDGRYIFAGMAPGNYTVIARAAVTGATPAPPPGPAGGRGGAGAQPLTLYATTDIVVDGRDIVAPLDLKPGMTIAGRVTFDSPERAPKELTMSISLLALKSGPALSVPPTRVAADGTFRWVGVPPGRYRIDHSAGRELDDWRLISATISGREVLDSAIEVRSEEDVTDLVMRFSDRPSELAGRLQTSSGTPATAYSIVVFSASREFWIPLSRRVRALRPATDGGFSVKALPAGDYYVAALTDIEPGEWYDPAFLAQLIATSAKVAVRDGQKTVQDLMIK